MKMTDVYNGLKEHQAPKEVPLTQAFTAISREGDQHILAFNETSHGYLLLARWDQILTPLFRCVSLPYQWMHPVDPTGWHAHTFFRACTCHSDYIFVYADLNDKWSLQPHLLCWHSYRQHSARYSQTLLPCAGDEIIQCCGIGGWFRRLHSNLACWNAAEQENLLLTFLL